MNQSTAALYDGNIADLQKRFAAIQVNWDALAPISSSAFNADLAALVARWTLARSWDGDLDAALYPNGRGANAVGDYDDIAARLRKAEIELEEIIARNRNAFGADSPNAAEEMAGNVVGPVGTAVGNLMGGGMVTGQHSLQEVNGLTAYYDPMVALLRTRLKNLSMWSDSDPDKVDLGKDLTALEFRWAAAHALGVADKIDDVVIALIPGLQALLASSVAYSKLHGADATQGVPAEIAFQGYVHALKVNGDAGQIVKGDFPDISDRLAVKERLYSVKVPDSPLPATPGRTQLDEMSKDAKTGESILGFLKLIGIGIAAGLVVQTITNAAILRRELSEHNR